MLHSNRSLPLSLVCELASSTFFFAPHSLYHYLGQLNDCLVCHSLLPSNPQYWHWKLFSFRSSFLVIFQNSQPYSRTGRTKVLNRSILVLLLISLAAQALRSLWNAPRAFYRRCIMSLLPPPSLSKIAPRYVNSSTSPTSSPSTTMFSLLLAHALSP